MRIISIKRFSAETFRVLNEDFFLKLNYAISILFQSFLSKINSVLPLSQSCKIELQVMNQARSEILAILNFIHIQTNVFILIIIISVSIPLSSSLHQVSVEIELHVRNRSRSEILEILNFIHIQTNVFIFIIIITIFLLLNSPVFLRCLLI